MTDDVLTQPKTAHVTYTGRKKPLFKLALWTGFLTLITLGVYRFWARTRIRKYFWSAITPSGSPLEYNGTGIEKFLGFLIAVAVLAVYLGVFQLLLLFFGYSLFTQSDTYQGIVFQNLLFYLAALATLPLIYYAQYRARRYIMSRTRWRGIRFGAEPAAWGYVKVGLTNLLFTVLTLGFLLPRQTFNMEKYRVDRSYFGDAQFHQGGEWRMLRPAMKQLYAAAAILVVAIGLMSYNGFANYETLENGDIAGIAGLGVGFILLQFGIAWFYVAMAIYNVASWRIMVNEKTLGEQVTFDSKVDTSDVIMAYVFGGMLAFASALVLGLLVGIATGFGLSFIPDTIIDETILRPLGVAFFDAEEVVVFASFIMGYLAFLVLLGAISTVSITQPIIRNYAGTITIQNADALDSVSQRAGDDFVEAEGFADALDVGAAF